MRKWISLTLVFSMLAPGFAAAKPSFSLDSGNRTIAEYFYTRTGNEILVPIRILGGVQLPGIYHLPKDTDLSTLIALSGGALADSDTMKMKFTRQGEETKVIDLHNHVAIGKEIKLSGGEVVYIPKRQGWISNETATTITAIVSVLSLSLTAYLIHRTVD